jgi:PAS domain S-box-containing protein
VQRRREKTLRFLVGGADMGARIRARDWAATPLGPTNQWPSSLRTLVGLLLSSRQPMFIAWGAEQIWFYNDAFTPILGDKHPDALGERSDVVWGEAWQVLKPLFDRVFAGDAVHMEDFAVMLNRHGRLQEAHFSFSYTPIFGERGEVNGLFGACLETTAQVIAIREREAAESRLQSALSAGDGIGTWDWDVKNDRVVADERSAYLYGVDPARAKSGAPVAQFLAGIHAQDVPMVRRQIDEALRTAGEFRSEHRVRQPDGSIRWVMAQGQVIRGEDGAPGRLPGAIFDITERKAAEEALYKLTADLEGEVESRTRERDRLWRLSPDLMAVTDAAGRMVRANPAWLTQLGWTEEEIDAHGYLGLVHPEDLESTRSHIIAVRDDSAPLRFENRYRAKQGSYRWQQWTVVPEQGFIYCVARDITEERKKAEALELAEEALRQSQKMEAVGQLTGGIAHDFNNLLMGIGGSLEIIDSRIKQGRFDVDRFVKAAQGATQRAAQLTHRLLAFSRRQTLDPKPTDANRLINGLVELIQRTIGPAVRLEFVAAAGLWNTLVDPGQLESAVLNLCINARDAMPAGGTLTIETANQWLDDRVALERELSPGQYISLCVSDSGTGMSPEVVAKAFEPFFTTKPTGTGTGLGLSMVYGFARQSAGQVRIRSEPGNGTTVCIYLPRHLGEVRESKPLDPAESTEEVVHHETILIVDDEPTVRMFVVDQLEEAGYVALEAEDGAAALRILNSSVKIDLLISDVGLPGGINGRQLADAARGVRPKLKILFITGYAESAVFSHGHLDSGMHVLTKPFTVDTLARRISQLLTSD